MRLTRLPPAGEERFEFPVSGTPDSPLSLVVGFLLPGGSLGMLGAVTGMFGLLPTRGPLHPPSLEHLVDRAGGPAHDAAFLDHQRRPLQRPKMMPDRRQTDPEALGHTLGGGDPSGLDDHLIHALAREPEPALAAVSGGASSDA